MDTLRLEIDASQFTRDLYTKLARGGDSLECIIRSLVIDGFSRRLDPLVACGKCIGYSFCPGDRSGALSLQSAIEMGGLDLWYFTVLIDMRPGILLSEHNVLPSKTVQWLPFDYGYGMQKTFKFKHKRMKTRERHEIQILHLLVPSALLSPVLDRLARGCPCDSKHLVPVPLGVWKWWQQFVCIVCGKLYFCDCFRPAIVKFSGLALRQRNHYSESGWPHEFLSAASQANFKPEICHLCTGKPSDLFYCHPMYGSPVRVRYGAYIEKFAIAESISAHDAENKVRDTLGLPRMGEGRVNEAQLYKLVDFLFADVEVVREASPDWLGNQRLDIYIPELSIAIEYQGEQHFSPVELFGGQAGFRETLRRDERKRKLCEQNGVKLIYFTYKEGLSLAFVEKKLRRLLPKHSKPFFARKRCGTNI